MAQPPHIDNHSLFKYLRGISCRFSTQAWNNCLANAENRTIITRWMEESTSCLLFIHILPNGSLRPSFDLPSYRTTKSVYCLKKSFAKLSLGNAKNELISGDLSSLHIENHLQTFLKSVCLPLLSNRQNRRKWSPETCHDIDRTIDHLFLALSDIHSSSSSSKIELFTPANLDEILRLYPTIVSGQQNCCSSIRNAIEGAIIKWSFQLDELFTHDRNTKFNPTKATPFDEIAYWRNRSSLLEQVDRQLCEVPLKKIGDLVLSINSVYSVSYKSLLESCAIRLEESLEVLVYVNALEGQLNALCSSDFDKMVDLVRPVIHCLALMWSRIRFYKPCDWRRMFRMVCNLCQQEATRHLDASSMFQADEEELANRLESTVCLLEQLQKDIHDIKSNLSSDYQLPTTTQPVWNFSTQSLCSQIKSFLQRVRYIQKINRSAIELSHLDRIVGFGGWKGKAMCDSLSAIAQCYRRAYSEWASIGFDVLDVNRSSEDFQRVWQKYELRTDVLERKLAQVLLESFAHCYTTEMGIRLIQLAGSLLNWNVIRDQLTPSILKVVELFSREVIRVEEDINHSNQRNEDLGLQRFAKTLLMIHRNRRRLEEPLRHISLMDFGLFDSDVGSRTLEHKSKIQQQLSDLETSTISLCQRELNTKLSVCLAKNLMRKSSQTELISDIILPCELVVNQNDELTDILRFLRTFQRLGINQKYSSLEDVYMNTFPLWDLQVVLGKTSNCFNFIRSQGSPLELSILRTQINGVNEKLAPFLDSFTWLDYDVKAVDALQTNLSALHSCLTAVHSNVARLRQHITAWSHSPLYPCFVDADSIEQYLQRHNANMDASRQEMKKIIAENLRLFQQCGDNQHEGTSSEVDTQISIALAKRNRFKTFIGLTHQLKARANNARMNNTDAALQEPELGPPSFQREFHNPYADYVESIFAHDVYYSAFVSLDYIQKQLTTASNPFIRISVSLDADQISLTPSQPEVVFFIETMIANIVGLIRHTQLSCDGICENIYHQTPPLDTIKNHIMNRTNQTMNQITDCVAAFKIFEHIWREDRSESNDKKASESQWLKDQILTWEQTISQIQKQVVDQTTINSWVTFDQRPFKQSLLNECGKWRHKYQNLLVQLVTNRMLSAEEFIDRSVQTLSKEVPLKQLESLLEVMSIMRKVHDRNECIDGDLFAPLCEDVEFLKINQVELDKHLLKRTSDLTHAWSKIVHLADSVDRKTEPNQRYHMACVMKKMAYFTEQVDHFRERFQQTITTENSSMRYEVFDRIQLELSAIETANENISQIADLFGLAPPDPSKLQLCRKELNTTKALWDYIQVTQSCKDHWTVTAWLHLDLEDVEQSCKQLLKEIRGLGKHVQNSTMFMGLEADLKNLLTALRSLAELRNPAILDRHWDDLMRATGMFRRFGMDILINLRGSTKTTLAEMLQLNLFEFEEDVKSIVDRAVKEQSMAKFLKDVKLAWQNIRFSFAQNDRSDVALLHPSDILIETLEDHQVQVNAVINSKYVAIFEREFQFWSESLTKADMFISLWAEAQRKWTYLESIFMRSDDLRQQLPEKSIEFDGVDEDFRVLLGQISKPLGTIEVTNQFGLINRVEALLAGLANGEKALNDYLEQKRLVFPRFYFIATVDLLDILSNSNDPSIATRHLPKLYDSVDRLELKANEEGLLTAIGMLSKEHEEFVEFKQSFVCTNHIEVWLNRITTEMQSTLRHMFDEAFAEVSEAESQERWLLKWSAQTALCISQIIWSIEVNRAFSNIQLGYESALRDYHRSLIVQLSSLIGMLLGDLTPGDRQRIMTICTIQVHSRDIVSKMIGQRVDTCRSFQWQSQLRHRWDTKEAHCFVNICDAQFRYQYEYLGNTPRLVITPLTDRCYITLTQSLHLVMGGAPSGPAGTGKTETTKDLGKGLGSMVYVFNCSGQMDYRSCAMIYKGLAQTGAWGCFDEFNRISVDVLSVVAVQVKCILDALKREQSTFVFMGETIRLVSSVGLFVTMNPGYAGRTELPENLKALFRPCAMVVPDLALICEIMLVAEGFQGARSLARKFISLYTLCRQLLSAQDHYDWGLRAIKSVLVVAGKLRRNDCQKPEDHVLMRALRDFNMPKIVSSDISIFLGLINDLFPLLDVPRTTYPDFEKVIRQSAEELGMQPDAEMILKVIQLQELLEVRHSVFLVGSAGTGKTTTWRTLFRAMEMEDKRPIYNDLNPKGVSNDELYGVINPVTREWRDGLFSKLMREQMNHPSDGPKWLVLDGDIDPLWIESLNTVMDDNKVLTLASNERISLTSEMRLLFEAGELRFATPATISRAGILFINTTHLTWQPFVTSWIESRCPLDNDRHSFEYLFDKYIPTVLNKSKEFKRITPVTDIAMAQMTCLLLDCLKVSNCSDEKWREQCFVFTVIWGFGATFYQDQIVDWQQEFNRFWLVDFKENRFPDDDVYGFWVDSEAKVMRSWSSLQPKVEPDLGDFSQCTIIPTKESVQIKWFLDQLMERNCPVMLIGPAGTGKSVILRSNLNTLSDFYKVVHIPFNFYTNSITLQKTLEEPLEKKCGHTYGPSCYRRIVYFADDLNMPKMDRFGTVQPHQIIRQFMDYNHWYDRCRNTIRVIQSCQFVACMNPAAGTFRIDPRLQRHFHTFAVSCPSQSSMFYVYHTILSHHLAQTWNRFSVQHMKLASALVGLSLVLHHRVSLMFLPTAMKFHYIFNLRDLSNIFQGMQFATIDTCPEPEDLMRLYLHEASRVYGDKLATQSDADNFKKLVREVTKNELDEVNEQRMFEEPMIYCHFGDGLSENKYMPVNKWTTLNAMLEDAQKAFNEMIGPLSLVLFEDAMCHVCRINRILECPRGNMMLVGVGGSGKQSLVRLASFISSMTVSQVRLRRGYNLLDFKAHINGLFCQVGIKNIASVLLMSDAQIPDETFLVVVNDLLAGAEIQDLFSVEEIDGIIDSIRNEVKQSGQLDTKSNCWRFFVDKVANGLKVVLCFSPVGSTLRQRARKFPAIANCTAVDWFHEWPKTALQSVSVRFLEHLKELPKELVEAVSTFMSMVLESVKRTAQLYWTNEQRHYYTTPKSYLESISLYSELLRSKMKETRETIRRLENGLVKLSQCAELVQELKKTLGQQEITMAEKRVAADRLIVVVGGETEMVQHEKTLAAEEERRVRRIEEDVQTKAKMCEKDLREAEPALQAAQMALNTLNKINLTELKSFGAPPQAVINVCAAVLVLCSGRHHRLPKDRSWRACKHMMGSVDRFLTQLVRFDKEHIPPKVIVALQPYLNDPEFDPLKIISKSVAAGGLCAWVINIHKFHSVYLVVGPKQKALKNAQQELDVAQQKLIAINDKIETIEAKWKAIQLEFEAAVSDKNHFQREAERTTCTIDLAHRLVNGLSSEAQRWHKSVERLRMQIGNLPGDMLFVSSFVAYVGGFLRPYRIALVENTWKPALNDIKPEIPRTKNFNLFEHFCDDVRIAQWNNEGLPTDHMSTENAIIFEHTDRWPLLIDPQLQGLKWIKRRFGDALIVTNQNRRNYLDVIEGAVKLGQTVLLEHVGESVDAVLDNLLSRSTINKKLAIKIGDREVDLHSDFRLILQTKMQNPHYKPELQAQLTLINFAVTRDGLEDQLLAEVVRAECPDLESSKSDLTEMQNSFKIRLQRLEIDLLDQLSAAGDNVLAQPTLVLNLEETKQIAKDVEIKAHESRISSALLDDAREQYRPVATRASILYFVLNDLGKINRMYQFSLKAFVAIFKRAIANNQKQQSMRPDSENVQDSVARIASLTESITYAIFLSTCRGLFERDKLVFVTQMVLQIYRKTISTQEVYFFFKFPATMNAVSSPVDFLSDRLWAAVRQLSAIKGYFGIDHAILKASVRWKVFVESETPELEKMPGEWHKKKHFQKLVILRTLRPDRVIYATWNFVEETMGSKYTQRRKLSLADSYAEINEAIPMFFILSPGVDPLMDVEKLGQQLGFCIENSNFHNVSLGQGQESVAEAAIRQAKNNGDWVVLQNVHLVVKWLPTLNAIIEESEEVASHSDYRLFISAEPAVSAEDHQIPQGILESSLKITNEPPTGMKANVHSALDTFSQDTLEMCTKETEFKSILFALCFFHSILLERRKFGAPGWNQDYPFSIGDLTISVYVLYNYLETNRFVPWEDLRYLIGEIMYGGHITDDWDRRLCRTYLSEYLQPDLIDGDLEFCQGFKAPSNNDFKGYHKYVRDNLPAEGPSIYRMHANSEIDFLTTRTDDLLSTIFQLHSTESTFVQHSGRPSKEESLRLMIEEYQDKLPDDFAVGEVGDSQEYPSPYTVVVLQETQRMNVLFAEIRRSLRELWLGIRGELNMTSLMEHLEECLVFHRVPHSWSALAYPSNMELNAWFNDLLMRHREMSAWSQTMCVPACVWLGGLFNPQSFLTAIMQSMARKHRWPLDRMCLNVDVTSKTRDDISMAPKDGAHVCRLFMEGARWDTLSNSIVVAQPKELYAEMPVVLIKATTQDKQDMRNVYECPVYRTKNRSSTYIWTFNIKSRYCSSKWILAGVAILLQA